jgi:hypothetical protein
MNFFEIGGLIIELDATSEDPQIPVFVEQVMFAGKKSYDSNTGVQIHMTMAEFMNHTNARNRDAIVAMIDEAPYAPPGGGLPGAAWNLLKKAPGFFVDVQQYSMTPRFVFEQAERLENR